MHDATFFTVVNNQQTRTKILAIIVQRS